MTTIFICVCVLLVGVSIATMLIACRLIWMARETLEVNAYLDKQDNKRATYKAIVRGFEATCKTKVYNVGNYIIYKTSNPDDRYTEIDVSVHPIGEIHFGVDKGVVYFLNMYTPAQLKEMLENQEVMQKISQIPEIASYFEALKDTVNNLIAKELSK